MERVKLEASEGAALVAECAPHGRVMETLVAERDGAQRGV